MESVEHQRDLMIDELFASDHPADVRALEMIRLASNICFKD